MKHVRQSLCLLGATLGLLASATSMAQSALPEGKIGIHYNRCDGNYEGWGVHLWKNPGIPIPGVEWAKPMMPNGKTDFGVLWQVDAVEFGKSGTVNYIVHKGDSKEQGGRDMKFEGSNNKEIWVLSGERKTFFSLEEANKARAENPCK